MCRKGNGAKSKVAHNRETLRTTGPVSPGDFLIAKESLQRSLLRRLFFLQLRIIPSAQDAFSRQGGIYRSDVGQTKTKPWGGTEPPPASRPRAQVKERIGRNTFFSIVRDEFRTGYSLVGLLASIARLRFTGIVRIALDGEPRNGLSSNCNGVFPCVSHRRGSPQKSAFIGVDRRPCGLPSRIETVRR
jgi:hypothetical protein